MTTIIRSRSVSMEEIEVYVKGLAKPARPHRLRLTESRKTCSCQAADVALFFYCAIVSMNRRYWVLAVAAPTSVPRWDWMEFGIRTCLPNR
jgi:hypothetical protein